MIEQRGRTGDGDAFVQIGFGTVTQTKSHGAVGRGNPAQGRRDTDRHDQAAVRNVERVRHVTLAGRKSRDDGGNEGGAETHDVGTYDSVVVGRKQGHAFSGEDVMDESW